MSSRGMHRVSNDELQAGDIVVYQDGRETMLTRILPRGENPREIMAMAMNSATPLLFALLGTTTIRDRAWPPPRYERDEPL